MLCSHCGRERGRRSRCPRCGKTQTVRFRGFCRPPEPGKSIVPETPTVPAAPPPEETRLFENADLKPAAERSGRLGKLFRKGGSLE